MHAKSFFKALTGILSGPQLAEGQRHWQGLRLLALSPGPRHDHSGKPPPQPASAFPKPHRGSLSREHHTVSEEATAAPAHVHTRTWVSLGHSRGPSPVLSCSVRVRKCQAPPSTVFFVHICIGPARASHKVMSTAELRCLAGVTPFPWQHVGVCGGEAASCCRSGSAQDDVAWTRHDTPASSVLCL